MAIFSAVPPPPELSSPATKPATPSKTNSGYATIASPPAATPPPAGYVFPSPAATRSTPIDIDAWTIHALESLSVSPLARGTRSPLTIPIDSERKVKRVVEGERKVKVYVDEDGDDLLARGEAIRRPPSRRDSMRKREMLLKGKEGSRQRRRWENDRLMHVPNAQPPAPSDWQPHPTHPIHHIPYALASYWDHHSIHQTPSSSAPVASKPLQKRNLDRTTALQAASKRNQLLHGTATGLGAGEVPRDLREAAKRSQVVKGWVKDLEAPIREWVKRERKVEDERKHGSDDDEEEIVFVGRKGTRERDVTMSYGGDREKENQRAESGMVMDSFGDVQNASYKRWLTHSISAYYGLESHSIILQEPTRKVVCISMKQARRGTSKVFMTHLPRPLWEICC